ELAPLISDKLQFTKTHNNLFFETCNKHADKTDRFQIRNITHFGLERRNRYPEQVPVLSTGAVGRKVNEDGSFICDKVCADLHVRLDIDFILKIFFRFTQSVIPV